MSSRTFVTLSPTDGSVNQKWTVRYFCEGGFTMDKEVSDDIARIIQKAIEYGKNLKAEEIRKALNL